MSKYNFTKLSQEDLIKIRRFTLEHWGSEQSRLYLGDLQNTLQILSEMPLMGKSCLDDLGKNVYRFPFGKHIVYYLVVSEQEILVIAILHQSMVPNKHLDNRL